MANQRNRRRSRDLFEIAQKYMPGGVSSPVRSFQAVHGQPIIIASGHGCHVYDVDGNEYIDYVSAYGPLILGHTCPDITSAIASAAESGTAFGATSELEIDLATLICKALPSVETVRFVNSGTEATMSALRLARAFTGRDKVVKFEGCYHGHADGLLAKAGSGLGTFGLPDSPGVPKTFAAETLVAPYNDLESAKTIFHKFGDQIAAAIVEPVAANMGVVAPAAGFLAELRKLSTAAGSLLIFDEVITGFRLSYGGAQQIYNIRPDLTCLGKVIGGGLPVGAYGGRRDIMELLAPTGPVYQAGTLSGNPLAMAAGLSCLQILRDESIYAQLEMSALRLGNGLQNAAKAEGVPVVISRVGSLLTLFFSNKPVTDYASAKESDSELYAKFFAGMLERGIFLAPSQFEAMFVSLAHSNDDSDHTIEAATEVLQGLS